tara:strand:- start:38 stop:505 length:468 start_codon:yes stop_codon:yes gene_type:complete
MKKYLEKNYLFNISMENVPKNYRFELEDEYKINLKKEIDTVNLQIQYQKNQAIENNEIFLSIKNLIYENKLKIYFYNGDFYNFYRTFLKYKKYCFKQIEEYQNNLENNVTLKYLDTGETFSKENGYIEFCNIKKEKLEKLEGLLEYLYESIIDDL